MIDLPPLDAKHELVMSAAGFDGHSVTTYRFRSSRPPEQLADALRERWQAEGLRYVEATRGEWLMLSSRRDGAIETLQLRRTATGTEGLHSLWQRNVVGADGASDDLAARIERIRTWLPRGARPIRELVHRDGPRQAATVVAIAADPSRIVAPELERRLATAGFARDSTFGLAQGTAARMSDGSSATSGQAIAYRRDGEEVIATVAAHRGETAIVLHWSRQ